MDQPEKQEREVQVGRSKAQPQGLLLAADPLCAFAGREGWQGSHPRPVPSAACCTPQQNTLPETSTQTPLPRKQCLSEELFRGNCSKEATMKFLLTAFQKPALVQRPARPEQSSEPAQLWHAASTSTIC